jgi:hypothetical protein
MERVCKDNSYDSAYIVEKVLSNRMKMVRDMMKKRKYEALGETRKIDETPTVRDSIHCKQFSEMNLI